LSIDSNSSERSSQFSDLPEATAFYAKTRSPSWQAMSRQTEKQTMVNKIERHKRYYKSTYFDPLEK